ncbi:Flp pilus assembly complex ATPase component TadA [Acidithiobacillus sp. CV18-2]|uniref:Flp pilus assembly complex ATPase component TadA n=1 Tax=Igneacidithiobacillus copahuensis TaxID=2724909 RepID=A0AAE2YSL6_9PROT|nr:ATPase, T2SS/T4P/T4SS family [Igneacidithiobacillus copahuensis]MBU2753190.1 Flp pilus assembly complex ATPase component TadA [Acidithiobacillus sp. CV18-3]MBU2758512.1 Flp pilus assembly complex ATPase component TadA [Acidithiobacillus sp. BN09-2]MBU2777599.1 Flp pilus assembly complex ATPase component TadA [Acidithiobacillus sp. CV18-2]MBU2797693.1 Flp pilus assembly complex ATPase component TadA [Acidithiobacillus sp. VAN18-2]MBU2798275.1 Flp pilus assembly complex ATPase component TadA 
MFRVVAQHHKHGLLPVQPHDGVCVMGRSPDAHLRLEGWNVGKEHARLVQREDGVHAEAVGALGSIVVNGERVKWYGPLSDRDIIEVAGVTVRVEREASQSTLPSSPTSPTEEAGAERVLVPAQAQSAPEPDLPRALPVDPRWMQWRQGIEERLRTQMDLRRLDLSSMSREELQRMVTQLASEVVQGMRLPPELDRERLIKEVVDEAVGLGPLEDLLADETVTEIMVNRFDEVFIERSGRLAPAPTVFSSEQAVRHIIDRIVAPIGRRIDESSPLVDARLHDGSRVNAVIPPVALKGANITIRKFSKKRLQMEDLIGFGSVEPRMAEFLRVAVEQRKNIVISGGTGSGKTTLLNVLSNYIPPRERVVTIEDAAELRLYQPNLVSMEARPANVEGKGAIPIRELVRNALRMRPDRIVVGECRGGEALDMLQAMNTGHDGSLTTAHANSPRDMLSRMEVMVMMAGMELPLAAIREQIASAIDIIVQITRFSCGSRKLTAIVEVTGTESGVIQLQELFSYRQQGFGADGKVRGSFRASGSMPEFYEEMRARGLPVDTSIFLEEEHERS